MLSKTEREALEVIVSEHGETRRGARGGVIRMALGAKGHDRRRQVDDALLALTKAGLVISGPNGWVPTDDARPALAGADGDGTGEALPEAAEYPATVERIGEPVSPELLERCAALISMQLRKSYQQWQGGDAQAVNDIAWLRETAQMIVDAGGEA